MNKFDKPQEEEEEEEEASTSQATEQASDAEAPIENAALKQEPENVQLDEYEYSDSDEELFQEMVEIDESIEITLVGDAGTDYTAVMQFILKTYRVLF